MIEKTLYIIFLLVGVTIALSPAPALAYSNLGCVAGEPVGTLFDTTASCSGNIDFRNIFTSLVCEFHFVLDEVLKRIYCGIQAAVDMPLRAGFTLYIIVYGIQLAIGQVRATAGEIFIRLFKVTLVWLFAMNSAWGINFMYNFFNAAVNEGIGWVIGVIMTPGDVLAACRVDLPDGASAERYAFQQIDYIICSSIMESFSTDRAKLMGFITALTLLATPLPITMMVAYFFLKALAIFIRALLVYLLGMSAIAFLITLSPIFLCFALFRTTFRFFDDWLRFMISFTLQVVLIFAAVAMWVIVIRQLGLFFYDLTNMIILTAQQGQLRGALVQQQELYKICEHKFVTTPFGLRPECLNLDPAQAKAPSELINDFPKFMEYLTVNALSLATVAYVFDALMKNIPMLAKQLAGPAYAPQIGGGHYRGAVKYAGVIRPENVAPAARQAAGGLGGVLGGGRAGV